MVASLAESFTRESSTRFPGDWTDLQLDLRIDDEERYVEAAVILAQCNAQPYSRADWHWRTAGRQQLRPRDLRRDRPRGRCASSTGRASTGELALHEVREGRVEVVPMWGRPQSVRDEFAKRRAQ